MTEGVCGVEGTDVVGKPRPGGGVAETVDDGVPLEGVVELALDTEVEGVKVDGVLVT